MITLRAQLSLFFRHRPDEWIPSGALQRMQFKNEKDKTVFTPQNVGRTLRKMEAEGSIAVSYEGTKHGAKYKYLPSYLRKYYRTSTQRMETKDPNIFTLSPEKIRELRTEAHKKGYAV